MDDEDKHLMEMFCQKNDSISKDGYRDSLWYYRCPKIDMDVESLFQKKHLNTIFKDYLSIQKILIDTKLKQFLSRWCDSNDVDYLYSKLVRRRNVCALFPCKSPRKRPLYAYKEFGDKNWYDPIMNKLNSIDTESRETIKRFCIIYNSICNLLLGVFDSYQQSEDEYGFDSYVVNKHKQAQTEKKENSDSDSYNNMDLAHLCEMYILEHIPHTLAKAKETEMTSKEDVKDYFFHDKSSLNQFSQLITYCVQDIKLNSNLEECLDVYKINKSEKCQWDYGLVFYIINRLAFVVFHDLLCKDNEKQKQDENNKVMFPDCILFFQFLYNFGIYTHCYPWNDKNETRVFSIREYCY